MTVITADSNICPFIRCGIEAREDIKELLMQYFLEADERFRALGGVEAKFVDQARFADLPKFLSLEWGAGCVTNVVGQ